MSISSWGTMKSVRKLLRHVPYLQAMPPPSSPRRSTRLCTRRRIAPWTLPPSSSRWRERLHTMSDRYGMRTSSPRQESVAPLSQAQWRRSGCCRSRSAQSSVPPRQARRGSEAEGGATRRRRSVDKSDLEGMKAGAKLINLVHSQTTDDQGRPSIHAELLPSRSQAIPFSSSFRVSSPLRISTISASIAVAVTPAGKRTTILPALPV